MAALAKAPPPLVPAATKARPNLMEEARRFNKLLGNTKLTVAEIEAAAGCSMATVYARARLLQLAPDVQAMVERGELNQTQALNFKANDQRKTGGVSTAGKAGKNGSGPESQPQKEEVIVEVAPAAIAVAKKQPDKAPDDASVVIEATSALDLAESCIAQEAALHLTRLSPAMVSGLTKQLDAVAKIATDLSKILQGLEFDEGGKTVIEQPAEVTEPTNPAAAQVAQTPRKFVLHGHPPQEPGLRIKVMGDGQAERMKAGIQLILGNPARHGLVQLGQKRFASTYRCENGAEVMIRALRTLWTNWDEKPNGYQGERRRFLEFKDALKQSFGVETFAELLAKVWEMDTSVDPIDLNQLADAS